MTKKTITNKKPAEKSKQARIHDEGPGHKPGKTKHRDKTSGKKNTSLRLDKQTLKALKIRAIENDTSVQSLIESLIRDYLKKK